MKVLKVKETNLSKSNILLTIFQFTYRQQQNLTDFLNNLKVALLFKCKGGGRPIVV